MNTTKQKVLIATVLAAVLGLIYIGWNYHEANVAQKQTMWELLEDRPTHISPDFTNATRKDPAAATILGATL